MTIETLTETKKGWVNPTTKVTRYYVTGSHYVDKGSIFFSTTKEKSRYTWEVPGKGFFHGEKCYNGSLEKELQEIFSEETIV